MSKDLKEILVLCFILMLLIFVAWSITFFSGHSSIHKQPLFTNYELEKWDAIQLEKIVYILNDDPSLRNKFLVSFLVNPTQKKKIFNDWTHIYVLEESDHPQESIRKQFTAKQCMRIYRHDRVS